MKSLNIFEGMSTNEMTFLMDLRRNNLTTEDIIVKLKKYENYIKDYSKDINENLDKIFNSLVDDNILNKFIKSYKKEEEENDDGEELQDIYDKIQKSTDKEEKEFLKEKLSNLKRELKDEKEKAKRNIKLAIKNYSKNIFLKTDTDSECLKWLKRNTDFKLDEDELSLLGQKIYLLSISEDSFGEYIKKIKTLYKDFRKNNTTYYHTNKINNKRISPLECDMIVLCILRFVKNIRKNTKNYDNTKIVENLKDYIYGQVLVDEATDFSTVQLSCMKLLVKPDTNSMFLCGDINQRLTKYGAQSLDDIKNVLEIDCRKIDNPYRQTRTLQSFSEKLLDKNKEYTVVEDDVEPILFVGDNMKIMLLGDNHETFWSAYRLKLCQN
jgi:hypothetical protein